jgi:hypothetical protein
LIDGRGFVGNFWQNVKTNKARRPFQLTRPLNDHSLSSRQEDIIKL